MKIKFLVPVALLCSLAAFASECEKNFFFGGVPRVTRTLPGDTIVVLTNCGYVVGYSEARRDPLWAAYRVKKVGKVGEQAPNPERQDHFRSDKRTTIRVVDDDYTNSGYDRGHMAPSYAMGSRYGTNAQNESFFMSNMCPQKHSLNGGTWANLESCEADKFANAFDEVWIIAGPIFKEPVKKFSDRNIQIPSAFYKIIIDEDKGKPRVLGFVMDHGITSTNAFDPYLMNVKAIQTLTGVEFFPSLPADVKTKLEKSRPLRSWKLPKP